MSRAVVVSGLLALALAAPLAAQDTTVAPVRPDTAREEAAVVQQEETPRLLPPGGVALGYRRTPLVGLDPFQQVIVPHWGLVLGFGADVTNNTANFKDIGAFMLLGKKDSITPGNVVDALGLVPKGQGLQGLVGVGGGVYLGGPLGSRLALGLTAQGRAYGSFLVDDSLVSLLRDGNAANQTFAVGQSHGAGLATAEAGAHLLVRLGAIRDEAGLRIILGAGARFLKPIAYARAGAVLNSPGTVRLTSDSLAMNVQLAMDHTLKPPAKGSGLVTDWLVRLESPERHLAFEAMLTGVGSVKLQDVEQRLLSVNVATTSFNVVKDSLNKSEFRIQDTTALTVTMPTEARFAVNWWALPLLQLDAAYTTKVTGDFATPAVFQAGATLRLINWLPLRVGIVNEGHFGTGLSGGIAIESRVFYLAFSGLTYGGAFQQGKGAGGNFGFGFYF